MILLGAEKSIVSILEQALLFSSPQYGHMTCPFYWSIGTKVYDS